MAGGVPVAVAVVAVALLAGCPPAGEEPESPDAVAETPEVEPAAAGAEPYHVGTWHEVLGKQELEVTVEPGKVAEVVVTHEIPPAK